MTYIFFFVLHIAGGCVTLGVAVYAAFGMWRARVEQYRTLAIGLGMLAAFEIVTGALLSIVSIDISAATLCNRIVLYLTFVFCVELMLLVRIKNASLTFPTELALSPIAASLAVFAGVLALGF